MVVLIVVDVYGVVRGRLCVVKLCLGCDWRAIVYIRDVVVMWLYCVK